jgi:cytochrome c oxidase subunit 1
VLDFSFLRPKILIRMELAQPRNQILGGNQIFGGNHQLYNMLITTHAFLLPYPKCP